MNKDRRKAIAALVERLDELANLMSEITEATEAIRDDEAEYLENMPDSMRDSERGLGAEQSVSLLEDSVGMLSDLDVETLRGYLEDAAA